MVDGADDVLSSASKRMELSARDVNALSAADVAGPLDNRISNAFNAKAL